MDDSGMSTTGNPEVGQGPREVMAIIVGPRPTSREEVIESGVKSARFLYGLGFPFDEAKAKARAERAYDRSFYPLGFARQIVAVRASADRTEAVAGVCSHRGDPRRGRSPGDPQRRRSDGRRRIV